MLSMVLSGDLLYHQPIFMTVRCFRDCLIRKTSMTMYGRIQRIQENALRTYCVWVVSKAWFMKRVRAIIHWAMLPGSWITSNQQSEPALSMFLVPWPWQWVGSLQERLGSKKHKHGGASRILLSIFFGISNALLALLRLHKTWQVTHSLHGNLIKKVTQGFLPSRLCASLLYSWFLSTHPDFSRCP